MHASSRITNFSVSIYGEHQNPRYETEINELRWELPPAPSWDLEPAWPTGSTPRCPPRPTRRGWLPLGGLLLRSLRTSSGSLSFFSSSPSPPPPSPKTPKRSRRSIPRVQNGFLISCLRSAILISTAANWGLDRIIALEHVRGDVASHELWFPTGHVAPDTSQEWFSKVSKWLYRPWQI